MKKRGQGTVEFRGGVWQVRVSISRADGTKDRPWIPMPGIPASNRDLAERRGAIISAQFRASGGESADGESVTAWMTRYHEWRKSKIERADTRLAQYNKHVAPLVGHLLMSDVTEEDGQKVVAYLDKEVEEDRMGWKTAKNVWGIVSKGFKDACRCKDPSLKILKANPFINVAPPEKGQSKQKQYLYPNELLKLLTCETIPLERRRLYAFAVYAYMRAGEIAAFGWDDLDVEQGICNVREALARHDKRSRRLKDTKTGIARRFTVESPLIPMLIAMEEDKDKKGNLLFPHMPSTFGRDGTATQFREDLLTAGITRPALHKRTKRQRHITFHDLRATAVTWAAVRGDSPIKIMGRSGHETLEVLTQYVREAESIREGFGEVFPMLPTCLWDGSEKAKKWVRKNCPRTVQTVQKSGKNLGKMVARVGFESPVDNRKTSRNNTKKRRPPRSLLSKEDGSFGPMAQAILLASKAGQWDVVKRLSRQLSE